MSPRSLLLLLGLAVSAFGQSTSVPTVGNPAPALTGTAAPSTLYTCDAGMANLQYIQTSAGGGIAAVYVCDKGTGSWAWDSLTASSGSGGSGSASFPSGAVGNILYYSQAGTSPVATAPTPAKLGLGPVVYAGNGVTLQQCVNQAANGLCIVPSGYTESPTATITVSSPVYIQGQAGNLFTPSGNFTFMSIASTGVTVDGLTVNGAGLTAGNHGVVDTYPNFTLKNNTFTNIPGVAMYGAGTNSTGQQPSNLVIDNNNLTATSSPIFVETQGSASSNFSGVYIRHNHATTSTASSGVSAIAIHTTGAGSQITNILLDSNQEDLNASSGNSAGFCVEIGSFGGVNPDQGSDSNDQCNAHAKFYGGTSISGVSNFNVLHEHVNYNGFVASIQATEVCCTSDHIVVDGTQMENAPSTNTSGVNLNGATYSKILNSELINSGGLNVSSANANTTNNSENQVLNNTVVLSTSASPRGGLFLQGNAGSNASVINNDVFIGNRVIGNGSVSYCIAQELDNKTTSGSSMSGNEFIGNLCSGFGTGYVNWSGASSATNAILIGNTYQGATAELSDSGNSVIYASDVGYASIPASSSGSGGAPSGAAGGGLAGTYPNPTVASVPSSALPATIAASTTGNAATATTANGLGSGALSQAAALSGDVTGSLGGNKLGSASSTAFDIRKFGAVCNGASHPIGTALGVSTAAGIAGVTLNGATPYSWLTNGNWAFHISTPVQAAVASGGTVIQLLGVAGLSAGQTVSGTGIPSGDTIASVNSSTYPYTITLATGTTAALSASISYIEVTSPLTDAQAAAGEMDWLAAQAAVQKAISLGGGTVVIPRGSGCVFSNSNSPGSALGTLVLPSATDVGAFGGTDVDLVGEGNTASQLVWPVDLGIGRYGVSDDVPYANSVNGAGRYGFNFYVGRMSNLTLSGPQQYPSFGTALTVFMEGYAHGARRVLRDVDAAGFLDGASYIGDHTTWQGVSLERNSRYGLYLDAPSSSLYADNQWIDMKTDGNGLAGIGVNYGATLSGRMYGGYGGGNPFWIFREPVPASVTYPAAMVGDFYETNMNLEWIGNTLIYDASGDTYTRNSSGQVTATTQGTKTSPIARVQLDGSYISQGGVGGVNPNIAGYPSRASLVDVGAINGLKLTSWTDAMRGGSGFIGTSDVINATSINGNSGGLLMEGDIDLLISDLNAAGKPLINTGANNYNLNTRLMKPGMGEYRLTGPQASYCAGGTPTTGNLIDASIACAGSSAPAGTNAAGAFLGVLLQPGTISPAIYASSSQSVGPVTCNSAIASGYYVKRTAAGQIVQAAGMTDSPVGRLTGFGGCSAGGTTNISLLPQ